VFAIVRPLLLVASLVAQAPPISDTGSSAPGSPTQPTNQPGVEVDSRGEDGTIGVGLTLPAGASTSGSGSSSRPLCSWERALVGDFRDAPGVPTAEGSRPTDQVVEQVGPGEVARLGWWKSCPPAAPQFVWVSPAVDIQVLIDGAAARARSATPAPVPDLSPPAADGSFVNLGLWLAVEDPGVTSARVDLADQWAQVRAEITGFQVDFGNGDVRTCDGIGTAIVDVSIVAEGPCGYTYLKSSPDAAPYVVTVTSTYAVTYTTSTGRSGSLAPLTRSTSFTYDVDEIQTVGVSN
jgi:hypothetical protein